MDSVIFLISLFGSLCSVLIQGNLQLLRFFLFKVEMFYPQFYHKDLQSIYLFVSSLLPTYASKSTLKNESEWIEEVG